MDRVKVSRAVLGASLGILLAVLVLPSTNWTLMNAVDRYRFGEDNYLGVAVLQQLAVPANLTDFASIPNDPQAKFFADGEKLAGTGESILAYAQQHPNDPAVWAEALSFFYKQYMHYNPPSEAEMRRQYDHAYPKHGESFEIYKSNTLRSYNYDKPRFEQVRRNALFVAKHGEELEPDNAYFAFAAADIAWAMGDRASAERSLDAIAKCTTLRDYHLGYANLRVETMERAHGYRGENARMYAYSGVLLPEYASQKEFAKEVAALPRDARGLRLRLRILQACGLTCDHTTVSIGFAVALADTKIVLNDGRNIPIRFSDDPNGFTSYLVQRAREFEGELSAAGIEMGPDKPMQIVARECAVVKVANTYLQNSWPVKKAKGMSMGEAVFDVLFAPSFFLFALSMAALLLKLPEGLGTALTPYVCGIGFSFSMLTYHSGWAYASILLVFALLRCLPGLRKRGLLVNSTAGLMLLAATPFLEKTDWTISSFIIFLFLLVWGASRIRSSSAAFWVLAVFFAAVVFVPLVGNGIFGNGSLSDNMGTTGFGFFGLVGLMYHRRWKPLWGISALAAGLSILVLGYVVPTLAENNRMRATFNQFSREADRIRQITNEPPSPAAGAATRYPFTPA